jgi:hypothetical protein
MTFKFKDTNERALLAALQQEKDEAIEGLKHEEDPDTCKSLEESVSRCNLLINAINENSSS